MINLRRIPVLSSRLSLQSILCRVNNSSDVPQTQRPNVGERTLVEIIENTPLSKSQIIKILKENDIRHKLSKTCKYIQTKCTECDNDYSNHIWPEDSAMSCSHCGHQAPYVDLQTFVKRISVRKTETEKDGEVNREEEKRIEETLRRMESPEEFDSDLHDQVSYLNLMSQFKEKKKDRLMRIRDDSDAPSPRGNTETGSSLTPMPADPNIRYLWTESVDFGDLDTREQDAFFDLRAALGIERISNDTLTRYNIRAHMDNYDMPAILYPRYKGLASRLRPPVGLKVIRKVGSNLEKENYPMPDESLSKQRLSGIFGYHMLSNSDKAVILTTNERDALAVYEATGALALALPRGELYDSNVLPFLEDFEQIFLWFPSRQLEFAKEWGNHLNGNRCYLIKSQDRPIELVRHQRHKDVRNTINQNSVRMRDKGFRSMTDIREEVKADILFAADRLQGFAKWKRFAPLNKYLKGFRPGELTVLTGATGIGKTTFLCEYSLDLYTQGVRTLFCSFEMPEEKILKWMLIQFAGKPLTRVEYSTEIDKWYDKFERTKGPLTIMKTDEFIDKKMPEIAHAIKSHVINNGVQHLVIDNLQFLVNQITVGNDSSDSFDRYYTQDKFLRLMRQLATEQQIHITMVVHPRKTETGTELGIQHYGGTAQVTQEADNCLVIQRRRDEKDRSKYKMFLHIIKNRYGGLRVESDTLEMVFQPATYSHTLIDHTRL